MITKIFLLIITFIVVGNGLPSTFDLRVQPSLIKYADYSLQQEGTCIGHAYTLQLTQILSNAYSLAMKYKIKLSSQHLLDCISGLNDLCHDVKLENLYKAIDYISAYGVTTQECIKNRVYQKPNEFCPLTCTQGTPFPYLIKGIFSLHTTIAQLLQTLTSNQITSGFLILKTYAQTNLYSSQNPQYLDSHSGQVMEYRVGEIVAWRNKGLEVAVRMGSGQGWGYNGFAWININSHKDLIVAAYTVNVKEGTRFYSNQQQ